MDKQQAARVAFEKRDEWSKCNVQECLAHESNNIVKLKYELWCESWQASREALMPSLVEVRDAASRFCQFFAMLEAMQEIDGNEPIKDTTILLSIMGCGASDNLTAGDFRKLGKVIARINSVIGDKK